MNQELYADGIGEITVTGSIVRIDLVSLSATERDEKNNPKARVPAKGDNARGRLRQRGRPDAEGDRRSGRSRRRSPDRRCSEAACRHRFSPAGSKQRWSVLQRVAKLQLIGTLRKARLSFHEQHPQTSLQCLALVARHHGVDLSPERLLHDYAIGDNRSPSANCCAWPRMPGCVPARSNFRGSRWSNWAMPIPCLPNLKTATGW